ncbi:MAG: MATE family efflux transporter [Hahellaceae bacterium]|nr:MATE family efflux transporter [Hahellaceae bacterium]
MVSQSVLNLVDAAMVGSLGEVALAGVGIGSYANFLMVSLVMGLSSGVQAMVARRRGEGRTHDLAQPLNTGLAIAILLSVPLMLISHTLASPLIDFLNSDKSVQNVAIPYFEVRTHAILAVAFNFSFRGYWNGLNRSFVYFRTLFVIHATNIILSYGLIYGHFGLPELGAEGAAWGTTLSLYLGTTLYFFQTYRSARPHGFLVGLSDPATRTSMLQLSLPNSLQQFVFAAGISALFWILGQVGTDEVAVANILINLALFLILPAVGLGMAATTLVSEALGREAREEAYRWGWYSVQVSVGVLFLLGIPMWLTPQWVLGLFLHQPHLIELGTPALRITGLGITLDATAIVLTQALLGAGANRAVMKVSFIMQWCFFLPLAYIAGPVAGYGLLTIWILQLLQRCINSWVFAQMWIRREWSHIRI